MNTCEICNCKATFNCDSCVENNKYFCSKQHLLLHKKQEHKQFSKSRSKSPSHKYNKNSKMNNIAIIKDNDEVEPQPQKEISKEEQDLRRLFEQVHSMKKEIEIKFNEGNYVECILLCNKCLVLSKKFYQEDHIFIVELLFNLSESYVKIGNLEEAIFNLENLIIITEQNKNQVSIANSRFKANMLIGATSINIGDFTKALKVYEITEKEAGNVYSEPELNLKLAAINLNIGICYIQLNNFSISEKYLRKGQKNIDGLLGNEIIHRLNADINENIGLIYDNTGKSKEAILFYKKSLKVKFSNYGENSTEVLELQYKISSALINLKQYKEAEEIMTSVCDVVLKEKVDLSKEEKSEHEIESYYRYGVYFYTTGVILLKLLKRNQAKDIFRKASMFWNDTLNKSDPCISSLNSLIKLCENKNN